MNTTKSTPTTWTSTTGWKRSPLLLLSRTPWNLQRGAIKGGVFEMILVLLPSLLFGTTTIDQPKVLRRGPRSFPMLSLSSLPTIHSFRVRRYRDGKATWRHGRPCWRAITSDATVWKKKADFMRKGDFEAKALGRPATNIIIFVYE